MIFGLEGRIHPLMELHEGGELSPSFKRFRQQFCFSHLLGSSGIFCVDRLGLDDYSGWIDLSGSVCRVLATY